MSTRLTCQGARQLAIELAAFPRHAQRRSTIAGKMRGQQHVYPPDRLIVVRLESRLRTMVIVRVSSTSVRTHRTSYIGCGIPDGYGTPAPHRLASLS